MSYDFCDPAIRCNADKYGATVFEVEIGRKIVRVLTFSQEEAEEIARSHRQEQPANGEHESFLF
jgi:hypothetical protein